MSKSKSESRSGSSREVTKRCAAIVGSDWTFDRRRCARKATQADGCCWQHSDMEEAPRAADRCGALLDAIGSFVTKRCQRRTKDGGRCSLHLARKGGAK